MQHPETQMCKAMLWTLWENSLDHYEHIGRKRMRICERPAVTLSTHEKRAEDERHVVDMEGIVDGDGDTAGDDSIRDHDEGCDGADDLTGADEGCGDATLIGG